MVSNQSKLDKLLGRDVFGDEEMEMVKKTMMGQMRALVKHQEMSEKDKQTNILKNKIDIQGASASAKILSTINNFHAIKLQTLFLTGGGPIKEHPLFKKMSGFKTTEGPGTPSLTDKK